MWGTLHGIQYISFHCMLMHEVKGYIYTYIVWAKSLNWPFWGFRGHFQTIYSCLWPFQAISRRFIVVYGHFRPFPVVWAIFRFFVISGFSCVWSWADYTFWVHSRGFVFLGWYSSLEPLTRVYKGY